MSPILIALAVFVVLGLAATAWLRRSPSLSSESQAAERGAGQLGTLRCRDFTRLVLQAMHGRGYRTVVEDGMPADGIPTDGGDIVLERNGERTLLSVKYGSASVVGAQALLGLGGSATLRGTQRVIVVTPGRFDEEAVRMANDTEFGLACYFYTRDIGRVWRVGEALDYGMVGINEGIISTAEAPFGGMKQSGIGREGSHHGVEEYLEMKYMLMGGLGK